MSFTPLIAMPCLVIDGSLVVIEGSNHFNVGMEVQRVAVPTARILTNDDEH
jgi:hypothetical protein